VTRPPTQVPRDASLSNPLEQGHCVFTLFENGYIDSSYLQKLYWYSSKNSEILKPGASFKMKTDIRNGLLAHATALILLHLALMTPPSILSQKKLALYFFPLILACNIYSWQMNLGFLAVVQGLWAGELLLFKNPREDFKLLHFERARPRNKTGINKEDGDCDSGKIKGDKEEKKDEEILPWGEPFPPSIYQRFWWVLKLTQSLRYTSWDTSSNTSALVIPQSSSSTKAQVTWLVKQLGFIGTCLLILDTTNLYMHYDPYFQITTAIDETLPRRLSTFLSSYYLNVVPPRAIRILVLGSQQYAIFSLVGCIPAVLMVVLGWIGGVSEFYGRKENYLPVMGNPLVILDGGLRGFWGKFWHQILREVLHPQLFD